MVEHLSTLVENFPGAANRTRFFTHILNLVAMSILCSFDAKKVVEGDVDDGTKALTALAQELELEDDVVDTDDGAADDKNDDDELDNFDCGGDDEEDGLGDGRDGMTEDEANALVPVQLMLTKVSHFKLSLKLSNPLMPT